MLSKNLDNKKYGPKLVFFNEKDWEDSDDFLYKKIDSAEQILALFNASAANICRYV